MRLPRAPITLGIAEAELLLSERMGRTVEIRPYLIKGYSVVSYRPTRPRRRIKLPPVLNTRNLL